MSSIKQAKPLIENYGIRTIDIVELLKQEDIAFLMAAKTDNTFSFFIAIKQLRNREDSWLWWCPTEKQIEILSGHLKNTYEGIDRHNKIHRKR